MSETNLDIILEEIEAYRQLHNRFIKYGEYIGLIRPLLVKTGEIKQVRDYAALLRKEKKRKEKLRDAKIQARAIEEKKKKRRRYGHEYLIIED